MTDAAFAVPITRPHLPPLARMEEVLADVYRSGMLSNFGKYSRLLEARAADVLGHPSPLCVSSCDVGLVLAWRALGCRAGEVITPSFTFCSTVNALRWNGLTPVFADVDPATLCVDPDDVRRLITPATVGIAAVHTFGLPAAITELEALAREYGLRLVFDAAHGLGGRYAGRPLGAFGDASVFSLSGTKLLTSGEGGLATFRSAAAAERFVALRSYGFRGDYDCRDVGLNGKMPELSAGLGWLSLDMLAGASARRCAQVDFYRELLAGHPDVATQAVPGERVHGYKDFAVLFSRPELRIAAEHRLRAAGVQSKRYFFPVHRMKAYAGLAGRPLPVTDDVYGRVLCLPVFHDLERVQQESIARLVLGTVGRPRQVASCPAA